MFFQAIYYKLKAACSSKNSTNPQKYVHGLYWRKPSTEYLDKVKVPLKPMFGKQVLTWFPEWEETKEIAFSFSKKTKKMTHKTDYCC